MDSSNPSNSSLQWYVIQTKPRKEKEAVSYLTLNGLEVFNPLIEDAVGSIRRDRPAASPARLTPATDLPRRRHTAETLRD